MTDAEQTQLIKYLLHSEAEVGEAAARDSAAHVRSIEALRVYGDDSNAWRDIRYASGRKIGKNLSDASLGVIRTIKQHVDPGLSYRDNIILSRARSFTRRSRAKIETLELDELLPNPFLIRALHLTSPEQVIRITVWAAITRSIVTSWGLEVQTILALGGDSVEPISSGWDLSVADNSMQHLIQLKSGPHSMNKDMVNTWCAKIEDVCKSENKRGYIGFTYGNTGLNTATLAFLRTGLPDWQTQLLVGRALWEFVCDDADYPDTVLSLLQKGAHQVMGAESMYDILNERIEHIKGDFERKYGRGTGGVDAYMRIML